MLRAASRNLWAVSGLPAATSAVGESVADHEEEGLWYYLVVDPAGIRPRAHASYDKGSKDPEKFGKVAVGAVLSIERRRKAGWTRWLCIKGGGGWVFDISPKDKKVRLAEVEVLGPDRGEWVYEVHADSPIFPTLGALTVSQRSSQGLSRPGCRAPLLSGEEGDLGSVSGQGFDRGALMPVSSPSRKSGRGGASPLLAGAGGPASPSALRRGELVTITERVRPILGKGTYLKLVDSRGWAVDFDSGTQYLRRVEVDGCPGGESDAHRFAASTPSSARGAPGPEAQTPAASEQGVWSYVVLDPKGMTLRSRPSYDKKVKLKSRIEEGQLVTVVERREAEGMTFLRIESPAGWAFEQQPGPTTYLRMAEASVEDGEWWYLVTDPRGCGLRRKLSTSAQGKCGWGPEKGAMVKIVQRVQVGETTFLRLEEGNWIFDMKNGSRIIHGPMDMRECNDLQASVIAEAGVFMLKGPTPEAWARTKMVLLHEAKVAVARMVQIDGVWWSSVSKPGGVMRGWVPSEALDLDLNIGRGVDDAPWCAC